MRSEIIDGKEYREVTLRGRAKLIASDGSAINPIRRRQKATTHVNHDGYLCFGGGVPVHMYVARAWVDGYFEGAEVNHKDFNRQNNEYSNLEWVTHKDNVNHSVKYNSEVWNNGKRGIHNGRAIFTEEEVLDIRNLYGDGKSISEIIDMRFPELDKFNSYKRTHANVYNICKRNTWKHI